MQIVNNFFCIFGKFFSVFISNLIQKNHEKLPLHRKHQHQVFNHSEETDNYEAENIFNALCECLSALHSKGRK